MNKVLYIEASPGKEHSFSSNLAAAFLETYREANPDDEIEHLPLFEVDLPTFGAEGAVQKFTNLGKVMTGKDPIEPKGEWTGVIAEVDRLKSADKVLLSSPMWNYSVPWRLKQWIDLVTHVGLTVMFDLVDGKPVYEGQITDRPLQLILASGNDYEMRFPLESDDKADFQHAYLDQIFRFLGFTDIRTVKAQPTGRAAGPGGDELQAAWDQQARDAAAAF